MPDTSQPTEQQPAKAIVTPQILAETLLRVAAEQRFRPDDSIAADAVLRLLTAVAQRALGDAVQRGMSLGIRLIAERLAGMIEPR